MSPYDPSTWNWVTWALVIWASYYTVQFFRHFFLFRRLERAADAGDMDSAAAFNKAITGFPGSGFAKMLGKHPIKMGGSR